MRLDRVDSRGRLPRRAAAYWQRIGEGRYVGYRRTSGTWLARLYSGNGGYEYKTLGEFLEFDERQRFDAARQAAEQWFRHLDRGGSTEQVTVTDACATYIARLRRENGEAAAEDAEGRFRRLVVGSGNGKIAPDPIAGIDLAKLKPLHMAAWRERVIERGSKASTNRDLTPLRAALNLAYDERKVASDFAWSKALRPLKLDQGAGRRTLYIDREQRRALIEHASAAFRPLLVAWTLLPVRPGDIAKLRVEHLDARHRVLRIPSGKTATRLVPLPDGALAHFKECARSKLPGAWLVPGAHGGKWTRYQWRDEMRNAVRKATLPGATVAYTIRHSTITDLVTDGLDIFTVAKVAGTSVAMIERHYGHLQQEHTRAALQKLSL